MPVSGAMITELSRIVSTLCPIWTITSRDGLVAAYASHTRGPGRAINGAPAFVFNSVTYNIASIQATRDMNKVGLAPNSTQLLGVFDTIIKRDEVEGGRWKLATIVYEYVNYLDLTMGSVGKIKGVAGKWNPVGATYQVEVMSNASLLAQHIGEMTSPTDRNDFPAGVTKASQTITRNVVSSADRRHFIVDGAAIASSFYKYGVAKFTTGTNSVYAGMEIKDNVGNTIELQLPMPADIAAAAVVTLLAGYDGTREQCKTKFANAIDFNGEPDLPGLKVLFTYPE